MLMRPPPTTKVPAPETVTTFGALAVAGASLQVEVELPLYYGGSFFVTLELCVNETTR